MPATGQYPLGLQRRVLLRYKATGLGDESLGLALAASDASGDNVGSSSQVQSFRAGRCQAPFGVLEVLLDHCEEDPHALDLVLGEICRSYGRRLADGAEPEPEPLDLNAVVRLMNESGDVLRAVSEATQDDTLTRDQLLRIAKEADEAVDAAKAVARAARARAEEVR